MRQITYKYKVGDTIKFKRKYGPTASDILHSLARCTAKIVECRDYNGPCYRLEGIDGFFKEGCFAGIKEDN